MTVKYVGKDHLDRQVFSCLVADTKPTAATSTSFLPRGEPLRPGALCFETDNNDARSYWTGNSWLQEEVNGVVHTNNWPAHSLTLASGMSADGNGSAVTFNGGYGSFIADGDFGSGGVIKLQYYNTLTSAWVDVPGVSLAAEGVVNFALSPCQLRINLSGSTSPDLYAGIL